MAEGFSGMILIVGGTFDDASWLKPTVSVCDFAQCWLAISPYTNNYAHPDLRVRA